MQSAQSSQPGGYQQRSGRRQTGSQGSSLLYFYLVCCFVYGMIHCLAWTHTHTHTLTHAHREMETQQVDSQPPAEVLLLPLKGDNVKLPQHFLEGVAAK